MKKIQENLTQPYSVFILFNCCQYENFRLTPTPSFVALTLLLLQFFFDFVSVIISVIYLFSEEFQMM